MVTFYPLDAVLAVTRIHPFYSATVKYPPSPDEIARVLDSTSKQKNGMHDLSVQPLLHRQLIQGTITRLTSDTSPENTYRRSSYISITGGGSGKNLPMLFLTDVSENRNQRETTANIIRASKIIEPGDWVLNTHPAGCFYRALDLTSDMLESAGACVLNAGFDLPHEKSLAACLEYRVNVITGDTNQILTFAHYLVSLPPEGDGAIDWSGLHITKIIYTCEQMDRSRREWLTTVFGEGLKFYSMFASAESGPWAVANFALNTNQSNDNEAATTGDNLNGQDNGHVEFDEAAANKVDLIFDSRAMKVEVVSISSSALDPLSSSAADPSPPAEADMLPEGQPGHLVLTCLQRLRNPLVRYVSGDVGSVHSLPDAAIAQLDPQYDNKKGDDDNIVQHLKVLRLHGRDLKRSFSFLGWFFEFTELSTSMNGLEGGEGSILQWQIVLSVFKLEGDAPLDGCEVRVLRQPKRMRLKREIKEKGINGEGAVEAQIRKIGDPDHGADSIGKEGQGVNGIDQDQVNGTGVENDQVTNKNEINGHTDKLDADANKKHNDDWKEEDEKLLHELKELFHLTEPNQHLLKLVRVTDVQQFERSETSNKVVRFVDKRPSVRNHWSE